MNFGNWPKNYHTKNLTFLQQVEIIYHPCLFVKNENLLLLNYNRLVLPPRIELGSIHYQCIVMPLYYESFGGVNGNRTRSAAGFSAVYQIPHGGLSENRTLLVRVRAGYFAIKVYKPKLVPTLRFELRELFLLREATLPICPCGHLTGSQFTCSHYTTVETNPPLGFEPRPSFLQKEY